ncbi:MAG: DUF1700 domain-containing protein [Gammaproteobacteria bacterium]|jgi:uncharacterized membrane protein|nr:DUF1700 domain-containing protein [Gammaproteobacteria bacterium]
MNRDQFLSELRVALRGLKPPEIDDIVSDYSAHFAEAQAAGRGEQDVADALGDPKRLAKELRAEAGLRRWEQRRTPMAYFGAVIALCGLAAVDLIILLPLLCVLGLAAFVTGVVILAVIIVGFAVMASPWWVAPVTGWTSTASLVLTGVGLIAGGIGTGAFFLLGMEGALLLLSKYARLHYQLRPPGDGTVPSDSAA